MHSWVPQQFYYFAFSSDSLASSIISGMASIVDSLVAPLSLLNALIAAITLEKGAELRENYEALEEIWDQYEVYDKFEETSENV